jgi:uncharacterized membrane protein
VRIRAIDWLRGLVIALMTVDHSGSVFDAAHMHGDTAALWKVGSPLPAGEFLTRWITHLCAPTFFALAGASLALSAARRANDAEQTRFIVTRGLFLALIDPFWMGLGFAGLKLLPLQVLYGLGLSMVCMAFLRKLPTAAIAAIALGIIVFLELTSAWHPTEQPLSGLAAMTLFAGPVAGRFFCIYPLIPWLPMMMLGWLLGRFLLAQPDRLKQARSLALLGVAMLAGFLVVRGLDGYGNWHLHRDSLEPLQWLHVSKYPPSVTFVLLELGIAALLLAAFLALDAPQKPRRAMAFFGLLGSTALFFYLLHVHLMSLAQLALNLDRNADGLLKTWGIAAIVLALLAWPCVWYRRYKQAHPNGLARYV